MLIRHNKGNTPTFTFTADFHELVRGDLRAGPAVLRYDPFRIVPHDEVPTLPATQRPIVVGCRFYPSGGQWTTELRFLPAAWIQPDWDPTGQGTILEAPFDIPEDTVEFEFWFTYKDGGGQEHYDSDMGANFWLRFPSHDLKIESANLSADPVHPTFSLSVISVPEIDAMKVRWRYTALPPSQRQESPLAPSTDADGSKRWGGPKEGFPAEAKSPIAFDLVYTSGGHSFTDDNEGTWYILSPSTA